MNNSLYKEPKYGSKYGIFHSKYKYKTGYSLSAFIFKERTWNSSL